LTITFHFLFNQPSADMLLYVGLENKKTCRLSAIRYISGYIPQL